MKNVEVVVINDGVHVEIKGSQYEGSNVESASEDSVIGEEGNAQRQDHIEPVVRQRKRPGVLE